MKLPDPEQFKFKDCVIGGDECWLITPNDMSTKWDSDNARFRSCVVRKSDNVVVSQGFRKFVNFGERPEFEPWNDDWDFEAFHKIDGSLLIVSKYKGELIVRTRGTIDARQLDNGHEIDLLIEKYPKVFDNEYLNRDGTSGESLSILLEWTTPSNIIVLRESDTPKLTLVGIIGNESGRYANQDFLDDLSSDLGVERPKLYHYDSISECIADVKAWEGKEGVVIYSPDYQTMKKIKADLYCELHKLATGMNTTKDVLNVFMESPKFTEYSEFYEFVETTLDYEIAEKCKEDIRKMCDAYSKVVEQVERVKKIVDDIRNGFSRKEQAMAFQKSFSDWRLAAAFQYLDTKEVDDKVIRKGIEANLEL